MFFYAIYTDISKIEYDLCLHAAWSYAGGIIYW